MTISLNFTQITWEPVEAIQEPAKQDRPCYERTNAAQFSLHGKGCGLHIESGSKNELASATAEQSSVFKKVFSRVAGGVLGAARAVLTFLWSPVTALKYLGIALAQACRGEWKKARKALGLALTAPLWTPVDGFLKTYERFAAWGDGREFCDPREEDNWLERQKASAKEDVVTKELQDKLNYGFVNVICGIRP